MRLLVPPAGVGGRTDAVSGIFALISLWFLFDEVCVGVAEGVWVFRDVRWVLVVSTFEY